MVEEIKMNEKDLCKLRTALEQCSLGKAIENVEKVLKEMGYEKKELD
jgi:hypothetical protein